MAASVREQKAIIGSTNMGKYMLHRKARNACDKPVALAKLVAGMRTYAIQHCYDV